MALSRKPQEIVEGSSNPLLAKHESWGRIPVDDIADILNGFAFKSTKFTRDKGTPLIRIRDVGKSSTKTFYDGEFDETYLVNDGDLLVGMDGDFRCAIWKGGKALLNQRVCKISLKTDEYDFKFLSYVLQPYLDAIHAETSAVTVKHLSSRSISEIPLPLPPKEQQKRIVAKIEELFSHIDAGIEALKKTKLLLKQYHQSVLKAAVTGELTKEWREANKVKLEPASQLLERILKERRQKWEEQQLEQFKAKGKMPKDDKWKEKYSEPDLPEDLELPNEWVTASLDQLTEYITSGSRGWAKYYADSGATFIRAQNLKYDKLGLDSIAYVNLPDKAEGMRTRVKYGDILITITGANVTKTGYVNIELDEAYVSQHVALCRPTLTKCVRYLYTFLISKDGARKKLEEAAYGAGKPGLNLDNLKTLQIALPSIEEQEEIVRLVEQQFASIQRLDDELGVQLRKTEKNKQSVLASAFMGSLNGIQ